MDISNMKKNLKKNSKICTLFKYCLIVLSVIVEILSVVYLVYNPDKYWPLKDIMEFNVFILVLSVISLILTNKLSGMIIKKEVLKRYLIEYENSNFSKSLLNEIIIEKFRRLSNEVIPLEDCSPTHLNREKRREWLIPITLFLGILFLLISIIFNNFIIVLLSISFLIVFYVYADYLPHANNYAVKYDKTHGGNGLAIEGLAKIYKWEYQKTYFDKKNLFYKQEKEYSSDCIKYILNVTYRDIHTYWSIINITLLIVNIISMFIGFSSEYFQLCANYFRVHDINSYSIIQIILVIIMNVINLIQLMSQDVFYEDMTDIAFKSYYNKKTNYLKHYFKNSNLQEKYINDIMIVRGIFQYNSLNFDKGFSIEDLNINDRMLFIHKAIANISRLKITISCLILVIICLLIYSNAQLWTYIVALVLGISIYFLCKNYLLHFIGKNRIIRRIKKMIENEEDTSVLF